MSLDLELSSLQLAVGSLQLAVCNMSIELSDTIRLVFGCNR